jgi:glycosyltransferase involved in cell wall biosynthesis
MNPLVVIPVFNHERAVGDVVDEVLRHGLPVLLIDDGSSKACGDALVALAAAHAPKVALVRLEENQGKGGAVMAGLREAARRGYSHAMQLDADGQHDLGDIPRFLEAATRQPGALVTGYPVYDASVPRSRLYGRLLTHVWVWINSLSLAVKDSMCGFRVYPLAPVLDVIDHAHLGRRMDFDPEIAVRLVWRGVAVVNLPTKVSYPKDGVSHFDVLWDNVRISGMHARLFFGMLVRLPLLLWRRLGASR